MSDLLTIATGNYLRPNGHGGYMIRQSDLSAWSRCQIQKFYYDQANADPAAPQPEALSATVFGTVIHHVFMNMELWRHQGMETHEIRRQALRTWEHYWNPDNIATLTGARWPTQWIARQTRMGLLQRGRDLIQNWTTVLETDRTHVLALEYQFAVPIEVAGRTHTLTGTIDQLAIKTISGRKPHLAIRDWKSGKKPSYLRWNNQGTSYAYATSTEEFWTGWPDSGMGALETFDVETMGRLDHVFTSHGYALHRGTPAYRTQGLPLASRKFFWGDLNDGKFSDGGWRVEQDYDRLRHAIDSYVRACEAEIYSVNLDAGVCQYCPFKATCAGVGLPSITEGAP